MGYLNVFEVRWLCFVRKQKRGQNYSGRIIVWNQGDKIIRGRNNREQGKLLSCYEKNISQDTTCRKDFVIGCTEKVLCRLGLEEVVTVFEKDICNVWEIREDAAKLSQTQIY